MTNIVSPTWYDSLSVDMEIVGSIASALGIIIPIAKNTKSEVIMMVFVKFNQIL